MTVNSSRLSVESGPTALCAAHNSTQVVCLQGRRGQEADGPGVFVREVNGLGWRALNLSLENPGEASEEAWGRAGPQSSHPSAEAPARKRC